MSIANNSRPTYAKISLDNLIFNFNSAKNFIGGDLNYMAVVKANAYGHGAVRCAQELEKAKIECFGVATPEEGLELRQNGINSPITCLGGFWEGQEEMVLANRLTPVIYRLELAQRLNYAAADKNVTADIHLKIDTGMGRIGIRFDELSEFLEKLKKFKNLNVKGVMTHFAAAEDSAENDFTNLQIKRFYEAVTMCEERGFRPFYKDLANSPGAVIHKDSRSNLVRLGGILYGLGDDILPPNIPSPKLKPVMSIYSKISHLKPMYAGETLGYNRSYKIEKDSIIATIPIGYYDGIPRGLSNKGRVIVNKTFAPIVGRVSMDWIIVNVTDVPNVSVNDEVLIIGQHENLSISAADMARLTETISYEITCGVSDRVSRIYDI